MRPLKRKYHQFNRSLNRKIILFFAVLIFIGLFTVGGIGFLVAQDTLDQKGETILKNSVVLALEVIDIQYKRYQEGTLSEEEAQEVIKETLMGPMGEDGKRRLHRNIDLGDNGYLIIYDLEGNEVMHPTLEGQNVWNVTSFDDDDLYVVQEQINVGKNGGGFTYYSWLFPDSKKVGQKISYVDFDPHWEWIVAATAYTDDFSSEAYYILFITILLLVIIMVIATIVVASFINKTTHPIIQVTRGMDQVAKGKLELINSIETNDELESLVNGYNGMVAGILRTNEKLMVKNERLQYLAFNDDLTGLPNRNGFKTIVEDSIMSDIKSAYLIQIDIRNLKMINSTYGFDIGDQLIGRIGWLLNEDSPTHYYYARTSGKSFSLWCSGHNLPVPDTIFAHIRSLLNRPEVLDQIPLTIDTYFSLVKYPEQGHNFDLLYRNASLAMKYAKEHDNRNVCYFDPFMDKALEDEITMRTNLEKALNKAQIQAWYQMKVDYETGKTVGVEALARWQSDELGFISPGVFIPAIHKFHLDILFGNYMIDHIFSNYQKIIHKYGDVKIAINISPTYFDSGQIIEATDIALEKYNVPANRVILEVTEDIFIGDIDAFSAISKELKSRGISLSIDDFGTGYSSLNYLKNLDIDEIKVDKVFIDQIQEDEDALNLLKSMCHIAELFGYDIVAEGVETKEQLEVIKETQLKIIQGYLFSKPEPL